MSTAIFFPHDGIESLEAEGRLERSGDVLVLGGGLGRYGVREAVHVLEEVTGGEDVRRLVGTVQLRSILADELGAEILGESMLLDQAAYAIASGILAEPLGVWSSSGTTEGRGERASLIGLGRDLCRV